MARKKTREGYTQGSGNVFADLGLADAEELLLKAELTRTIAKIIAARGLSQVRAAEVLGIDQPTVSKLIRGRLLSLSIDRLARFLTKLNHDVDITVRESRRHGKVRVRVAA